MVLSVLTILVEQNSTAMQFGSVSSPDTIKASFNPAKLSISRTVNWEDQKAAKRDNPELQFTGSEPQTMAIDLLFDTWDTLKAEDDKDDVRKVYTNKLMALTTVEKHGEIHRPPVVRLVWGNCGTFFQGVLQQLDIEFTMFTPGGTPVRATTHCMFKRWKTNGEDLGNQFTLSSDLFKVWTVRLGQSLASIAAQEYGTPRAWRAIAEANDIDDPLRLVPGSRLVLPPWQAPPWETDLP